MTDHLDEAIETLERKISVGLVLGPGTTYNMHPEDIRRLLAGLKHCRAQQQQLRSAHDAAVQAGQAARVAQHEYTQLCAELVGWHTDLTKGLMVTAGLTAVAWLVGQAVYTLLLLYMAALS